MNNLILHSAFGIAGAITLIILVIWLADIIADLFSREE